MTDFDKDYLTFLGYIDGPTRHAARVLWETADALSLSRDARLEVFQALVGLCEQVERTDPPAVWVPFAVGEHVPGLLCRVRPDAYAGDAGDKHNERLGTISAIRNGRVYVTYKGHSAGTAINHPPQNIEVLDK